jgi:hypothetical protein
MSLSLEDLDATLEDERHNGWGYATKSGSLDLRPEAQLDCAVIDVANELGLSYDDLFIWTDSKYGRWLVDTVAGQTPTKTTVRKYLNQEAIDQLREELG